MTKNESNLKKAFGFVTFVSRDGENMQNVDHLLWEKKSTKILAYSQTQFATLFQNDVKNVRK